MDIDDYKDRYVAQYETGDWFETVLVAARRRRVLDSLSAFRHDTVLEVGCGLEPLFTFAPNVEGWTVVEPVPDFAHRARSRAAGSPHVTIREGFLEDVAPTLAAPFSFVVASSLLHEVPNPEALLAALRSVSSRDTTLHIDVPNVRSFHRLLALELGLIADLFEASAMEKKFQRTTRFDAARLHAMCEAAGFRIVRSGTYFIKPFTHSQMAAMVDRGVVDRAVLDGLDRMTKYMPDLGCELFADLALR